MEKFTGKLQIVVEGISEEQIQKDIECMTKGWRLFFIEPSNVEYQFINSFWGAEWNGTPKDLKEIILEHTKVGDKYKQHICVFKYNGVDRFIWCSWTKQLYDCVTKEYHLLEPKFSITITNKINELFV